MFHVPFIFKTGHFRSFARVLNGTRVFHSLEQLVGPRKILARFYFVSCNVYIVVFDVVVDVMSSRLIVWRRRPRPEPGAYIRTVRPRLSHYRLRDRTRAICKTARGHVGRAARISIPRNTMKWRGPGFIPEKFETCHDYSYLYKDTTAGGWYDWVLRGNSIYDPDVSLGGETVIGETEVANLYNYYKVTASSIEVTGVNNDSDDPLHIVIIPTTYSASFAIGSMTACLSYPYSRHVMITNQAGQGSVSNYMRTAVIEGVKDLDSVNYQAMYNANPTTMWYWHVVIFNRQGNANAAELRLHMKYWVEWTGHPVFAQ